MISEKIEKYRELARRLMLIRKMEDDVLDDLDLIWFKLSPEEHIVVRADGMADHAAMKAAEWNADENIMP